MQLRLRISDATKPKNGPLPIPRQPYQICGKASKAKNALMCQDTQPRPTNYPLINPNSRRPALKRAGAWPPPVVTTREFPQFRSPATDLKKKTLLKGTPTKKDHQLIEAATHTLARPPPARSLMCLVYRGPIDHRNMKLLRAMVAGIPLVLGLRTRTQDPHVYVALWAPKLIRP